MDARLLTRLTNVVLVGAVGMLVAHLLMPARPGAALGTRAAFVTTLAGAGAVAGWRERRLRLDYHGRARGGTPAWMIVGGAAALALGAIAYAIVH